MFVLKEHVINVCSVIHIALHAKWRRPDDRQVFKGAEAALG